MLRLIGEFKPEELNYGKIIFTTIALVFKVLFMALTSMQIM